jgi:hypothetical protein
MAYPTVSLKFSPGTSRFATPSYSTIPKADLAELDVVTGRQSELDGVSPGTLTAVLQAPKAEPRLYDPNNASGSYYPNLTPGKKAQLVVEYDEFDGAAAVTYVGAGALASGDNASLAPALPAGTLVDRDLFVCFASIRNSGTGTVDEPAGWFTILAFGNVALFGCYATASTVAPTVTFTGGVAGATTLAQVIALRDCEADPALLVSALATQLNGSAQSIAVPALTVSEGGVVLVCGWKQDDWTGVAPLSGQFFSEAFDTFSTTGSDAGHVLDYRTQTGALNVSATSLTVTGGVSAISRAIVIAFRPYRGRRYELFNGWTTGFPPKYRARTGTTTMKASGPFGFLEKTTMPDSYGAVILADTPTAWYRLGDGIGQVITDSSGNGLHGHWQPQLSEVKATDGLIESDDGAVSLPGGPVVAAGKVPPTVVPHLRPLSVEFWVKIDKFPKPLVDQLDLSAQDWSEIVSRGGLNIRVFATTGDFPGAVEFLVADSPFITIANVAEALGAWYAPIGTPGTFWWYTISDGRRHHVVCTINAAGDYLAIWIDGVDRAYFNSFVGSTINAIPAFSEIDINGSNGWDGPAILDELAFYDYEMDEATVNAHYTAGAAPGNGDYTGARVGRVLDLIGWPAALRDLDVGQTILGIADTGGRKALDYLDLVANSEQGWLFEHHHDSGKVGFQDRSARQIDARSTVAQTLFTDDVAALFFGLGVVYDDIGLASDDRPAANVVTVRWRGGDTVVRDQASIDAYGDIPASISTLLESHEEAKNLAQWLLIEQSARFTRIRSVTVRPTGLSGSAATRAWQACLSRSEGDRVRVIHQPASTGAVIDQQLFIIGIEHHASSGVEDWSTTFHLAPASTTTYWILATSALGTNTRLSY